ncbi:TIGR04282 family arsenosugar biosynthesis glycosyltransferase [Vreelandella jeotgali]|uniref:TIGR04282 family arsenosugar biosynthesis glycosyltransferase n=1 Tax=Vreelandella jeotgali TaxID=553386 RepID=UPI00034BB91A|nr:TIGR04282 family arsenosugar biosynthesis glycosyltransferase [Halomonas jeotgali]
MPTDYGHQRRPIALHLLAKAPIPGKAKTRLNPRLGAYGSASAHAEMVKRCVVHACRALPAAQVTLWTALDHEHPLFLALQQRLGINLAPQPEGDLGVRIRHALASTFPSTPGPAMIMGSDCPSITPELIQTCAARLATHPVVILPAEDGGYGLIGTNDDYPALFRDIPWGGGEVLNVTRKRLDALGLKAAFPATVWDVDRPEDWQRYRRLYPRAPSLAPSSFSSSRNCS